MRASGERSCGHPSDRTVIRPPVVGFGLTMDQEPIIKRQGRLLPHWSKEGGIYAVCFRLADSIPQTKIAAIQWEKEDIEKTARQMKRELSAHERLHLLTLQRESIERFLRNGYGSCWLKDERIAKIVADALRFFENKNYTLFAWCIMPNHVHVVVKPITSHTLTTILRSWKSFTAKTANAILNRSGRFWQTESYDHLIRDTDDLNHAMEYTWSNPELAGLRNWQWRWKKANATFA